MKLTEKIEKPSTSRDLTPSTRDLIGTRRGDIANCNVFLKKIIYNLTVSFWNVQLKCVSIDVILTLSDEGTLNSSEIYNDLSLIGASSVSGRLFQIFSNLI